MGLRMKIGSSMGLRIKFWSGWVLSTSFGTWMGLSTKFGARMDRSVQPINHPLKFKVPLRGPNNELLGIQIYYGINIFLDSFKSRIPK